MRRGLLTIAALAACSEPAAPRGPVVPRILGFSAEPARIAAGELSTLRWETEGGFGVSIDPAVGIKPSSGTAEVRPVASTRYTLTLDTGEEILSSQTTVTVEGGPPAILSFDATPRTIEAGDEVSLAWRVANAERVTLEPDEGEVPAEGDLTLTPIATTTYRLQADSAVGSTSRELTVVVASGGQPFILQFSADRQSIAPGESVTLSWETADADAVTLNPGLGRGPPAGMAFVSPERSTVYTLVASGPGGTASASLRIDVTGTGAPRVLRFTATPSTIAPGGASTLDWETDNASGVLLEPGLGAQAAKDSREVRPAATTVYRLTALGEGGAEESAELTLTVAAPDTPVVLELSATPRAIARGGSSTLRWRTLNTSSVELSPGVGMGLPPEGSVQVSPTGTTNYHLLARGAGGATAELEVELVVTEPPPVITSFQASPASVVAGQAVGLSWTTDGASTASIDQGVGPVAPSGSTRVRPSASTSYLLTASGPGGATTAAVTVVVSPPGAPAIESFAASPAQIAPGSSTTLYWSVRDASAVRIDNGVGVVLPSGSVSVSPLATTTYTLTADGPGGTTRAPVTVGVASLGGDTCASAFELTGSASLSGNTLSAVDDLSELATCTGHTAPGPDQVYRVGLQAGDRLRATLSPAGWDGALYLLGSCAQPAASCLAGSDRGNPEAIDVVAPTAGSYYLVVDGGSRAAGGAYGLAVELTPAGLPNDGCAGALAVGRGGTFSGSTRGARADYDPGDGACTDYAEDGPDVVYAVTLAAGERLDASLSATWDAALYLVEDCAEIRASCRVGSDAGNPERIAFESPSAATYYLVVDGYAGAQGDYSLTVSVAQPSVGGESCSSAIVVPAAGGVFASSTVGASDDVHPSASCTGYPTRGPDRVYRVELGAGDVLEAVASFAPGLDGALYLAPNCSGACLVGSDGGLAGEPEGLRHVAGAAGSYYLVVDAELASSAGAHELVAATYTGESCASAAPLSLGAIAELAITTGKANDYSPSAGACTGAAATGPDRVYQLSLRPGDQLRAQLTPQGGYDPSLYLVSGCADVTASCVAGSDRGAGQSEAIFPVVAQAGTYYLVVDGHAGSSGSATLTATVTRGESCADAYLVPAGGGTYTGTTRGYRADLGTIVGSGSCTGWPQSGADAVYRVELEAGQTLEATLTSTWDAALYLVSDCAQASSSCLAGSDSGSPERLSFTSSGPRRAYHLIVDSYRAGSSHQGDYRLELLVR